MQPLNLSFQDGQSVSAAQLNSLVSSINELAVENNNLSQTIEKIQKSELMLIAQKSTIQTFVGDGQQQTITGWTTTLNKENIFSAATGLITIPTTATYTIEAKTLVSADNATAPRSKLSVIVAGVVVTISEDTVFQESTQNIQNYRRTHQANCTVALSQNASGLIAIQVWGSTQARIFADVNTTIKIWREI